jgi:hypothetical protein
LGQYDGEYSQYSRSSQKTPLATAVFCFLFLIVGSDWAFVLSFSMEDAVKLHAFMITTLAVS